MRIFHFPSPWRSTRKVLGICVALLPNHLIAQHVSHPPAAQRGERKVVHLPDSAYDRMKKQGLLDPATLYFVQLPSSVDRPFVLEKDAKSPDDAKKPDFLGGAKSLNSYCFIEPNPQTYQSPPGFIQLDDGGAGPFSLPFTFCFYGTNYNSFYINTNGNITFNGIYATFTPVGFPNNTTQPMIAPFWADVDFGGLGPNNTGVCYYQINPTNAIITWYNVGYYNEQHDKKNTFQVIITDGNDPVLPPGNNVGFRYKDMQWTTGAASCGAGVGSPCTYNGQTYTCGGNGGFCGAAAVVGANRNNGIDFVQFGQFDHPGTDFAGPFGNSGVDWLDFQTFNFNVCTSINNSNVPPVISASNICGDTLTLCLNDTVVFPISFLSPEQGQTTTVAINTVQGSGFTILSNNPGNVANISVQFVSSLANIGTNVLQFVATDNGNPSANTTYYLAVKVDSIILNPVITGNTSVCAGQTTNLSVANGPYDSYLWSPGNSTSATLNAGPGTYTVTVTQSGCSSTSPPFTISLDQPTVQIQGTPSFCEGGSTTLSAQPANFAAYSWSNGSTASSTQVSQPGTVTLTVTNANGCTATASVSVTQFQASVTINGPNEMCENASVNLTATGTNISQYAWSTGASTPSIVFNGGPVTLTITTDQGCTASDSFFVQVNPLPAVNFSPDNFCGGVSVPFQDETTVASGSVTSWQWTFQNGTPPNALIQNPSVVFPENSQNAVTLTVTTDKNCIDSLTKIVGIFQGPSPNVQPLPLCFGEVLFRNLTAPGSSPVQSFLWHFGDGTTGQQADTSFVHSYPEANATYTVQLVVTDANGCKDSISLPVQTLTLLDLNQLTNLISANGDGLNDEFRFLFSNPLMEPFPDLCYNFKLTVFNRWGNLVFETSDFDHMWKPGSKFSPGTYFWVLTYESKAGKMEKRGGTVTIVN
ncbi:MAG: PKD domain-containing protein [Flavobacteriales bacterium]|nr:PKD domain-containing protein [Flavobacteriales bacterium]MDW8431316.1 PKD domain-containing protein [Flavobacteriales bacterium]